MERSNPESVERLRENDRSCYVSAAHAASLAQRVSARTIAESMLSKSRDIALPSARTDQTAQQKTLEAWPTRVRVNTREASPLDHRETLCVAAIRFICKHRVHAVASNTGYRRFQGVDLEHRPIGWTAQTSQFETSAPARPKADFAYRG